MTNEEKTIFETLGLIHHENMTIISGIVPKANADSIYDHYNAEMQRLTDQMNGEVPRSEGK